MNPGVWPPTIPTIESLWRHALLPMAAVLLALTGCGRVSGDHYLVEVDPAFSPSDVESIEEAARSWEAAVDGLEMPVVIASCRGLTEGKICMHASSASEVLARTGVRLAAGHTEWNDVGGETWMRVPSSQWFEREVAHEMGHAMGLSHNHEGTLMYFSATGESPIPTADDVAEWREVRGF